MPLGKPRADQTGTVPRARSEVPACFAGKTAPSRAVATASLGTAARELRLCWTSCSAVSSLAPRGRQAKMPTQPSFPRGYRIIKLWEVRFWRPRSNNGSGQ
ncbi:MAG: hypothetical protein BJ554DRAFT_6441 [Olpidium bornovanus]|uniref:Uncharacterized protein n=1 Tax=Olpidium bornovanus TaxID=278681 RepID=A0A8H8DK01_9FUNG|nr:MAG: hypothetical protein BJ554DRAFT_6441 [Olpidium bornovanus]